MEYEKTEKNCAFGKVGDRSEKKNAVKKNATHKRKYNFEQALLQGGIPVDLEPPRRKEIPNATFNVTF